MRRGWELLALLIIAALLLQAAVELLRPLIPYMIAAALIGMVTVAAIVLHPGPRQSR